MRSRSTPMIERVADGVYFARSSAVNWTVLTDGDAVTLIDAGYPGDLPAVVETLRSIGHRPEQIAAVLVTHAHVDHIGSLPGLLKLVPGIRVLASETETRHVHREYLEQLTPMGVVRNAWRPGVLPWALRITRLGATKDVRVPEARPFPGDGALDVPGRPVPVPTPGHTSGHTCYHLPERGVVAAGDALMTAHPTSRIEGPQILPRMFNHDEPGTAAALGALRDLDAGLLLPGHGPAHRGSIREAVLSASARSS